MGDKSQDRPASSPEARQEDPRRTENSGAPGGDGLIQVDEGVSA
jgi:hypothetical protein